MVGGASDQAFCQANQLLERGFFLSGPISTPHLFEPGRSMQVGVLVTVPLSGNSQRGTSSHRYLLETNRRHFANMTDLKALCTLAA